MKLTKKKKKEKKMHSALIFQLGMSFIFLLGNLLLAWSSRAWGECLELVPLNYNQMDHCPKLCVLSFIRLESSRLSATNLQHMVEACKEWEGVHRYCKIMFTYKQFHFVRNFILQNQISAFMEILFSEKKKILNDTKIFSLLHQTTFLHLRNSHSTP